MNSEIQDIWRELRDLRREIASIPARFAAPAITAPVQLVETKPPLGVIQPDYRAGILEYGYPIGYPMQGGANTARDKPTYDVSGTLVTNIYSGNPCFVYSRYDCLPPGHPVYAVPVGTVQNASGAPNFPAVYEVLNSCQEVLFVTVSGTIGSGYPYGTAGTAPYGPIFSGSNAGGNYLPPYPTYGQNGTRLYPCQKAYGGGQASGMMSLQQSLPDAQQAYVVQYNGPWLNPGSYIQAKYTGPDGLNYSPAFSWSATALPGALNMNPYSESTIYDQYTWEMPIWGVPCSGNTGLACVSQPATSGGPFAVAVKNLGTGDMSSGQMYRADWSWQYQGFVTVANACCASGQYMMSGSSSGGR